MYAVDGVHLMNDYDAKIRFLQKSARTKTKKPDSSPEPGPESSDSCKFSSTLHPRKSILLKLH